MRFLSYPYQIQDAATNMAIDLHLLEAGPADTIRFRHYGWTDPSWTFGYTQRWQDIQADRPAEIKACVRRPTGGGIVDHRADFTYCLAIPNAHPWWRTKVCDVYAKLHQTIALALDGEGTPTHLFACGESFPDPMTAGADACFLRPAVSDVLHAELGHKIAGAALKRNRCGLLIQGSILASAIVDTTRFARQLEIELAKSLQAEQTSAPALPAIDADHIQRFACAHWNRKR